MLVESLSSLLLAWYGENARILPWRHPPGTGPVDPYRVWLSEVMLQQTTVAAVIPYFERFTARWPSVAALAAADDAEVMQAWAGLGYYARARNMLACARIVASELGGRFPDDEEGLRALPGIGAYTAAAIAAIAFDRPAVVVDGNVERVMSRLFAVETPMPQAKPLLRTHADALTPETRPGDYAQAVMDLGATICTPTTPACNRCPISRFCAAFNRGEPARFPVKAPKTSKPLRRGAVFWIEVDGHVLLVRRPPKGLLGGMLALPTTPWLDEPAEHEPPVDAEWTRLPLPIRHSFTHFDLILDVLKARLDSRPGIEGEWVPVAAVESAGLPTVFLRAVRAALEPMMEIVA